MGLAETSQIWVEQTCQGLHLTPPCKTLDEVVAAIAVALKRPIDIGLHDMEGSDIYGFCTTRDGRYKIAMSYQATRRQFIRTVLHELVHILKGDVTPDRPAIVYREEISLRDPHELEVEACAQALVSYLRVGPVSAPDDATSSQEQGLARFWDELGGFDR